MDADIYYDIHVYMVNMKFVEKDLGAHFYVLSFEQRLAHLDSDEGARKRVHIANSVLLGRRIANYSAMFAAHLIIQNLYVILVTSSD